MTIYPNAKTESQLRKALADANAVASDLDALEAIAVTADSPFGTDGRLLESDGVLRKAVQTNILSANVVTAAVAYGTDDVLVATDGTGRGTKSTTIDKDNVVTAAANFGAADQIIVSSGTTKAVQSVTTLAANLVTSNAALTPDNAIVRVDGTTRLVQTSTAFVDDNGRIGLGTAVPASYLEIVGIDGTAEARITRSSDDTSGARIRMRKSRGSIATPTVIANGDTIGIFTFNAYRNGAFQGSDAPASATIQAVVTGTVSGDSVPTDLVFSVTIDGGTTNTEAFRIVRDRSTITQLGAIINELGADSDTRVEGDSLTHMIFVDASAATENIALLATGAPNWQGMDRGLFIGNVSTTPSGAPTDGVFLYSSAGELVAMDSSGNATVLTDPPDPIPAPDFQVFTASGTWTKPAGNATYPPLTVVRHLIGGGGAGGSGRRGATLTSRGGGGGGGGGGYSFDSNLATEFDTTETVTIGAAGTPPGPNVTDNSDGTAGGNGGNTSMTATGTGGATLTANGGAGGGGGTSAAGGAGGAGGTGTTTNGASGGASAITGVATVGSDVTTEGRMAGAGGGGGGGVSSGNAIVFSARGGLSGGQNGNRGLEQDTVTAGVISGFPGEFGRDGRSIIAGSNLADFGGGGGGGGGGAQGAVTTSAIGFGGRGGSYGGGAGGGAGILNAVTNSFNDGGTGGVGLAIVITFFDASQVGGGVDP